MIQWLEARLTHVPMYPLVGGSLGVLVVAAVALAASGNLFVSPLAIAASTAVLVIVSAATSFGLGKLYGAASHLPSAVITALILTLILTPTSDAQVLLQYALIALIAQASKYVVTFRARHVFNPAAFGAFVGGLVGLPYASWWVGTPALFGLLAVAAFLVLYKTRQVQLGLVALVVGVSVAVGMGSPIWTVLASYPLLFMVGFMLSEPLTLPPLQRQKIVLGALVGLLVAAPFSIGWFHSSPEFALLVGNVVAFCFAYKQRRNLGLVLRERHDLTPTVQEIVLESERPLVFQPGQYVELTIMGGVPDARGFRRSFSVTSVPHSNTLTLGVKFAEQGSAFKRWLDGLPIGSRVQSTGITGDFIWPSDKTEKLLLVAGGIGITPFISQLRTYASEKRDVVLLYFVREPAEAAYRDVLDELDIEVHYFADHDPSVPFHDSQKLDRELLETYVPDSKQRSAYVSGSPQMVAEAVEVLRGNVRHIKTDHFSGY